MGGMPTARRPAPGVRSAAFFDLDKTIIAKSSSLAFSKPFQAGGLITRGAMLRSAYAQFVYLVGGADHDQMEKIRAFMSQLVEGWDVETVKEIVAETLHHVVDPIVYDEAVSLIEEHHLAGRDVIIVSASGAEVVEPIGRDELCHQRRSTFAQHAPETQCGERVQRRRDVDVTGSRLDHLRPAADVVDGTGGCVLRRHHDRSRLSWLEQTGVERQRA